MIGFEGGGPDRRKDLTVLDLSLVGTRDGIRVEYHEADASTKTSKRRLPANPTPLSAFYRSYPRLSFGRPFDVSTFQPLPLSSSLAFDTYFSPISNDRYYPRGSGLKHECRIHNEQEVNKEELGFRWDDCQ
ncbi:hypothetical protein PM082_006465 [Marasmius tenuissimus]|nr:hypothetical protein PM082_006465 [Marasmius tenuissimus]